MESILVSESVVAIYLLMSGRLAYTALLTSALYAFIPLRMSPLYFRSPSGPTS